MKAQTNEVNALTDLEYDHLWRECGDYIRFHPGARHRRRIILSFLRKLNFNSALDIGCGPGELIAMFRTHFPGLKTLVGVDLSPEAVEKNKSRFRGVDFHALNIEQGSLSNTFDLILCSEVIEHLQDRRTAFENMSKMLSPGGHLLISCPVGKVYPTEKHFGHTTHPTLIEIQHLAAVNGMTMQSFQNWGWPTYKILKEATNVNPDWAIRNFANGSYGWFQKLTSNLLYLANFFNISNSAHGCQLFAVLQKK